MNISPRRRHNGGFTLIELLVVMAIIAILASVILVGGTQAINAARRAKASYTATQVQTAIMNYYTEYGVYPVASGTTTDVALTTSTQETDLMNALCGNINASTATAVTPATVSNTRNVAYLTPKRNEVDTNGVLITPFSSGANDYYYSIAMDGDYSGVLGNSGGVAAQMPDFNASWTTGGIKYINGGITQGVAVWACCDTSNLGTPGSSTTPQFWVHTY
jgi:prepilin-type N-terminal cleavage/methylation domain-containing protein